MPAANQLELHPLTQKSELLAYMAVHKILPIAYSSLAPLSNWREGYKDIKGTFLCLEIDTAVLTSPVKMEAAAPTESNPNPIAFPHIFGPIVPLSCVTRQLEVVRDPADGTFLSIEGICE